MLAVSTANTAHPKKAPNPLRHPNGDPYRYELIPNSAAARYYADEIGDLIVGILPALDDEEAMLTARKKHAAATAAVTRATLLRAALLAGAKLTDEEKQAILGTLAPGDIWESPVPLILISTDYAPYTDAPAPLSSEGDFIDPFNILWIRPETNESYVTSLQRIGWCQVNRHDVFA